jgi:hypothetical protein
LVKDKALVLCRGLLGLAEVNGNLKGAEVRGDSLPSRRGSSRDCIVAGVVRFTFDVDIVVGKISFIEEGHLHLGIKESLIKS